MYTLAPMITVQKGITLTLKSFPFTSHYVYKTFFQIVFLSQDKWNSIIARTNQGSPVGSTRQQNLYDNLGRNSILLDLLAFVYFISTTNIQSGNFFWLPYFQLKMPLNFIILRLLWNMNFFNIGSDFALQLSLTVLERWPVLVWAVEQDPAVSRGAMQQEVGMQRDML